MNFYFLVFRFPTASQDAVRRLYRKHSLVSLVYLNKPPVQNADTRYK